MGERVVQKKQTRLGKLVGLCVCAGWLLKSLADDCDRRNAALFEFGCIVDTPRRAAASNAETGNYDVAALRDFVENLALCAERRMALASCE